MIIRNADEKEIITNVSMQEMYNLLTDEDINTNDEELNEKAITNIIAWLPNITEIEVNRYINNSWLYITFSNGENLILYNVGIEYAISCLVR